MTQRPLEDWEYPEPDDDEDEESSETVPCPACGKEVYESADRCPDCGEYVSPYSNSPLAGRAGWFVALGVLGVLAVLWMLLRA